VGRVGVVGGGNSAVDAARVALRQPGVERVTILYRRTRAEMPAFAEEVDAALEEGVRLETLVTPRAIRESGPPGRRRPASATGWASGTPAAGAAPVPIGTGSFDVPLDTLIVAISEGSDTDCLAVAGANRVEVDERAGRARRPGHAPDQPAGVFAGGDVTTGPATVIDAIAAGKRAAVMIDRYLRGAELKPRRCRSGAAHYVEPATAAGRRPPRGPPRRAPGRDGRATGSRRWS
jgi:NADPH-dependent glutamate synthase beta subunit-like oxidoreductase